MEIELITQAISTVGFPIVCVIGLAWFIFTLTKSNKETNAKIIEDLQKENSKREDRLYNEVKETREINCKAIETIAIYADRLDNIQDDIKVIKNDMTEVKAKIE